MHVFVILAIAGVLAGLINGVVGGASLMTFPLLVATGLSPVHAAVTNIVGMGGGNSFALLPHARTRRPLLRRWIRPALITAFGAVIGASLLRVSPPKFFESIVPVLVALATITMLLPKPALQPHGPGHPHTNWRLWASGIYAGYFGSGMGVISIAVLSRDGRLDMREVAIVKNLVIATANLVATVYFLTVGGVDLLRAGTLFVFSGIGGFLSSRVIDQSNPDLLRWVVVFIGAASSVYLTLRLFR